MSDLIILSCPKCVPFRRGFKYVMVKVCIEEFSYWCRQEVQITDGLYLNVVFSISGLKVKEFGYHVDPIYIYGVPLST